ncbi:MAG: hypothetical protein KDJ37_13470 [Hyphomicrobiaceae bacterium]|nr:hypothetical protein [Hyphomicrobiaceae bacterium]
MQSDLDNPVDGTPTASEVAIDYIKTSSFKVDWADGAVGGVTPAGYVHVAFYAERLSIPRRLVFSLTPDGALGDEIANKRRDRNSVVRELSTDVMMSANVAEQIGRWLIEMANDARGINAEQSDTGKP